MCYVEWAITAINKIGDARSHDFFKEKVRSVSKYRESIINVIGHAIADCVTKQNEFADANDGQATLITFKANPVSYSRANWNAVILYNLVNKLLHDPRSNRQSIGDILKGIKLSLVDHYSNSHIGGLSGMLDNSISDIKQYDERLKLREEISKFAIKEDPQEQIQSREHWCSKQTLSAQYDAAIRESSFDECYINFNLDRPVQIRALADNGDSDILFQVHLVYRPKNSPDEQWELFNNRTLVFGSKSREGDKIRKGDFYEVMKGYWNTYNLSKYLIQLVECDLELCAPDLRDVNYWIHGHQLENYTGQRLSISPKNLGDQPEKFTDYKDLIKDENLREIYFTNYRQIDPSKRPRPVQD